MISGEKNLFIATVHQASCERITSRNKIKPLDELYSLLAENGSPVLLTKGTFDILHSGHLHLLNFCGSLKAEHTDLVLVVAVASDDVVKANKGQERPFNTLSQRTEQISAIQCVDYVVEYNGKSPITVIETLKPIYYVKGQDTTNVQFNTGYSGEISVDPTVENQELEPLYRLGGQLIVYADEGLVSTTDLVNKIRQMT